jgi:isoleucyl-tRNA synthetase
VSQAALNTEEPAEDALESSEIEGLSISVKKAEGEKCQRCWNRSPSVGTFGDAPEVCAKCYGHIK